MARPKKEVEDVVEDEVVEVVEEKEATPSDPSVGLVIKSKFDDRLKEAEKQYRKLEDIYGEIVITNKACGGSVKIKSFELMPKGNMGCTCGNKRHYMIKYETID